MAETQLAQYMIAHRGLGPVEAAVELILDQLEGAGSTPATPHISSIGANAGANIPSGAKGYSFSLLTGTGTLGGVAITAPITIGDQNTLAVNLAYTTGAASSALLYYNT